MTEEKDKYISRRLLKVNDYSEAIKYEQEPLLTAMKLRNMIHDNQFLNEDWRVAVVVGDPGLGKSFFLKQLNNSKSKGDTEINLQLLKSGFKRESFDLKQTQASHTIWLFDGFDELVSSQIIPFYSAIRELLIENPQVRIVISSRTTFAQRHEGILAGINPHIYLLDRFSEYEIIQYMRDAGVQAQLIELARSLQRETIIFSVPRYLKYVCDYLNDPAPKVRDDLPSLHVVFQSVVRRSLGQEVSIQDMITNPWAAERVLAKLALVMEINQVNSITHDELLTFFDTASSDLKTYFLTPQAFTVLSERLLNFDGEYCSFHDREIQEYLASTEIARLPEPLRAVFRLCFDENTRILNPSWFNTLRFLFCKNPQLFSDISLYLLSISNTKGRSCYTLDDSFWKIAPRVQSISLPTKPQLLFEQILNYFLSNKFLIPYEAVFCLVSIYSKDLEIYLQDCIDKIGQNKIELSNIARLIGELRAECSDIIPENKWKDWLIKYATDTLTDLDAVRIILWALRYFSDETIISKIAFLSEKDDQFINEALIQVCVNINPEHDDSIKLILQFLKNHVKGAFAALMNVHDEVILGSTIDSILEEDALFNSFFEELSSNLLPEENFLYKIFSAKIEAESLCKSVHKLIEKLIHKIGQTHRDNSGLRNLCQQFALNNYDSFISIILRIIQTSKSDYDHYFRRGLAYFLTQDNKESISTIIQNEDSYRFDVNFLREMREEFTRVNQNRIFLNNINKVENVALSSGIADEIRSNNPLKDFTILNKIVKELKGISNSHNKLIDSDIEEIIKFVERNVFDLIDTNKGTISLNKSNSTRAYTISDCLLFFGLGIQIYILLDQTSTTHRDKFLEYLPFAYPDQIKWVSNQIGELTHDEVNSMLQKFRKNIALKTCKIGNLIGVLDTHNYSSITKVFKDLILDPDVQDVDKITIISSLIKKGFTKEELLKLRKELHLKNDSKLKNNIDDTLIEKFQDRQTILNRASSLVSKAEKISDRPFGVAYTASMNEREMAEKVFAKPLLHLSDPSLIDIYFTLLDEGFALILKDKEYTNYANYLWDIVFKYFDNLKIHKSYDYFNALENKIALYSKNQGVNLINIRLARLRYTYTSLFKKPASFISAVLQYNSSLTAITEPVTTPTELQQVIFDSFNNEIGSWLKGSGSKIIQTAYNTNKQKEVSIHRVLRGQLLESLNRRRHAGYSFSVIREPQMDDECRTDFFINYGFIGPCIVELKLASHKDLVSSKLRKSKSFLSLESYMEGYRSEVGVLIVLEDNKLDLDKKKKITDVYSEIKGIRTLFLDLPVNPNNKRANLKKVATQQIK